MALSSDVSPTIRDDQRGESASERQVGTVVVFGLESAGKSTVVAGIAECGAVASNFRGTTVACERYESPRGTWIDTPGLLFSGETEAARLAVDALDDGDAALLVVRATHLDDELDRLLPLVAGRAGAVVVTFWDKVQRASTLWRPSSNWNARSGCRSFPWMVGDSTVRLLTG